MDEDRGVDGFVVAGWGKREGVDADVPNRVPDGWLIEFDGVEVASPLLALFPNKLVVPAVLAPPVEALFPKSDPVVELLPELFAPNSPPLFAAVFCPPNKGAALVLVPAAPVALPAPNKEPG